MTDRRKPPPFDRELAEVLAAAADELPGTLTEDMLAMLLDLPPVDSPIPAMLRQAGLETRDVEISGHRGAAIVVSVVQQAGRTAIGPGFFTIHGGGMIAGDRWEAVSLLGDWLKRYNAVAVTVEYRLAPAFPDPTPVEDCYAGLRWTAEHAAELGLNPEQLIVAGISAGGGLAAGSALLARDRQGPALAGQLLICPMLDDRDSTLSSVQIDGVGVWDRGSNRTGWSALLSDRRGTDDVSIYAAPARASDLSGLPPTFIECGSADVFRDEDVAYAQAMWAAGGQAELHVWPGGFHGFTEFAPKATLSADAVRARDHWIRRLLARR